MITTTVRATDGVALALHRLDPVVEVSSPPVLLAHGAFASHRVWLRGGAAGRGLAAFLQARGHDVWLLDWRHHGASAREPGPFQWQFEDLIRRDAPAALIAVRRETGHQDVIWVGHSFGGVIGLALLAHDPGAGPTAVVTLGTPDPVTGPFRRVLAFLTVGVCRAASRFPARALRMGPEDEPALVLSDWMMWNVRGRWMGSDGFDYLAALKHLPTPLLSIAGSGDRLFAPPEACRALVSRLGGTATTFAVARPDLDHRGLLIDPRADEHCWPLIADWIALQASSPRLAS
jgi:pimeloyl-ACP methyl ester carboxylesterase